MFFLGRALSESKRSLNIYICARAHTHTFVHLLTKTHFHIMSKEIKGFTFNVLAGMKQHSRIHFPYENP